MRKNIFAVLSIWILSCFCVMASPVAEKLAVQAVTGWLNLNESPLGTKMNRTISGVESFDNKGTVLFYVVSFKEGGYVVTSADDMIQPIVAFSQSGEFDSSEQSPFMCLALEDMSSRTAVLEAFEAKVAGPGLLSVADKAALSQLDEINSKWQNLISAADAGKIGTLAISYIDEVRVPPLVQSKWGQSTVDGVDMFNIFTPNNFVVGCVATALAQTLRYFEYPEEGIGLRMNSIYVDGVEETAQTRGGDGFGGPYDWDMMPYEPSGTNTLAVREMLSSLSYDAGVSVEMDYSESGSGTDTLLCADALTNFFGYSNAVKLYREYPYGGIKAAQCIQCINPNLDDSRPVILGIRNYFSGHAIVCDGYGYNNSSMYHHLNMGWDGFRDLWYSLPPVEALSGATTVIYKIVYNIYTSGEGEILSGRVTDVYGNPLPGATVSIPGFSDVTDTNGIYALSTVTSGTYTVTASVGGYDDASRDCIVGTSEDFGECGNIWAVDFSMIDPDGSNYLTSVELVGTNEVFEETSEFYTCFAYYSDGSSSNVTSSAIWSEDSAFASIDANGNFTAGSVSEDQAVTVSVSYSEDGITKMAEKIVTIINVEPVVPVSLLIEGPDEILEYGQEYLTSTAFYSDGSSSNVTTEVAWSEDSAYTRIFSDGRFDAAGVYLDQSVTVSASYTFGGVTVTDTHVLTIKDWLNATYNHGDGSESDPYHIFELADLMYLSMHPEDYDKHFILTEDIDLSDMTFTNAVVAPDTDTAFGFQGTTFSGVFDGGGHHINNLSISAGYNVGFLGLFGNVSGTIRNLAVVDASIIGSGANGGFMGGICGQLDSGLIECCCAIGSVEGTLGAGAVGGLCGKVMGGAIINSLAAVDVTGQLAVGGFCGYLMNGTITDCYSIGAVTGLTTSNIGGFCGASVSGTCDSCFWDVDTSGQASSVCGMGKTTDEMQTESTFTDAGWNFDSVWEMDRYPILSCIDYVSVVSVTSVALYGPDVIFENSSTNYTCIANFSDGSSSDVTLNAYWSEDSDYASIDSGSGLLITSEVNGDQSVVVTVVYSYGRVTKVDTIEVEIKDYLFSGGFGTEADPYIISSKADLLYLGTNTSLYSKSFIMTSDIDLMGEVFDKAVIAFSSVEDDYDFHGTRFTGVFNGNGHAVQNLTIDAPEGMGYLGLFGVCSGVISNLCVRNVDISASGFYACYVGSLSGQLYYGSVSRCCSSGVINSADGVEYIGGLCGVSMSGFFEDSYSVVDLLGGDELGGFLRYWRKQCV